MKKWMMICLAAVVCCQQAAFAQKAQAMRNGYPISQVNFTQVKVKPGTFWGQRMEAARTVTIPLAFSKCESEHRYENFVKAAYTLQHPGHEGLKTDKWDVSKFMGFSFDDTDVYKTIEGASYVLSLAENKTLKNYIDSVLDIVAAAQEPDGYLYTARTINPQKPHGWSGDRRWVKEEELSHELYNLGHMVDAACAHYQATGSTKFLDIARRYADCVCREVGSGANQACVVPGHQIAEMALARLYLITGDRKYLDEAKFLLDYRGKTHIKNIYSQSHKPVTTQDEAAGHAVRATYMYAGMADVAALTGDSAYIHAIDRIWQNIVEKKMYITGGIGSTSNGEAFGANYELPNMTAYCETCAAIGNVYVNHRLFLLHGESKYYDVVERALYNGLISGMSIDGGRFFYPNPLASLGQHERQPWFGCACCPSNLCRFIPSLPGYVYAVKDDKVFVNLFLANQGTLDVNGKKVVLEQTTNYPWNGDIAIKVNESKAGMFTLKIRIPGWARNEVTPGSLYRFADGKNADYSILLNGQPIRFDGGKPQPGTDGYVNITRRWKKGDVVSIHFDMEARVVTADNQVTADRGMAAVQRGPLVYCAEWCDNNFDIMSTVLNQHPSFTESEKEIEGCRVTMLTTNAQKLDFGADGRLQPSDVKLNLIPYYAWCHRGKGKMRVWLSKDLTLYNP
ncbi:MAG: glycoside hydrolase family 127 protein [Prevotella sp.]|nr:glycoside hydrolase family 127 protein [Prevotella sp.]